MLNYIIRRLGYMFITLIIVAVLDTLLLSCRQVLMCSLKLTAYVRWGAT